MTLSIIIPVYNEEKTIIEILHRIQNVNFGFDYEIIVIDSGSTDGTRELLESRIQNSESRIHLISLSKNQGKGMALRRGFQEVRGRIIAIQDADLEYDPQELPKLIQPILENKTNVVYGSRFQQKTEHRYFIFYLGNKLLSFLFRIFWGVHLTDPMTGYKVFKREILDRFHLFTNGFEIEIELTTKILKAGEKILELPISYQSRTYAEGKKIKWFDGLKCIFLLIKSRYF
jgi:glycosyltransferase involved in cell wall biosynthesis